MGLGDACTLFPPSSRVFTRRHASNLVSAGGKSHCGQAFGWVTVLKARGRPEKGG